MDFFWMNHRARQSLTAPRRPCWSSCGRAKVDMLIKLATTLALGLAAALAAVPAVADDPESRSVTPVSPGGATQPLPIGDSCPTFNWSAADGAASYELVVVELDEAQLADARELEEPELTAGWRTVLRQTLPGGARGWTPPLDSCLRAGGAYAWFVGAAASGLAGPERQETAWSEPLFFRVDANRVLARLLAALSQGNGLPVESALLLRRWLDGLDEAEPTPPSVPLDRSLPALEPAADPPPEARVGGVPGPLALSTISGALNVVADEATTGSSYGIVGRSDPKCIPSEGCGTSVGVYGETDDFWSFSQRAGVYGHSSGAGVRGIGGASGSWVGGVHGTSTSVSAPGGLFENFTAGIGLKVVGNGQGRDRAALWVENPNNSQGMAAYLFNHSEFAAAHFYNSSSGEVLYLQNGVGVLGSGGGPFIKAVNKAENDVQFLVDRLGGAWSDVGFATPASDLAEMLPAEAGLEPGDVLVIGDDGRLARSRRPFERAVAGVYSTAPGFLGGRTAPEESAGLVPLAIAGIVPVKVTTEGGRIRPGDWLVASSTPGHATRARRPGKGRGVIGKALEPLTRPRGMIRMLVLPR